MQNINENGRTRYIWKYACKISKKKKGLDTILWEVVKLYDMHAPSVVIRMIERFNLLNQSELVRKIEIFIDR